MQKELSTVSQPYVFSVQAGIPGPGGCSGVLPARGLPGADALIHLEDEVSGATLGRTPILLRSGAIVEALHKRTSVLL